jgi:hypothetical protein
MALSMRFVPLAGVKTLYANGRAYPVSGATVDIPYLDGQAVQPDQATFLTFIGATTDRPTNNPGQGNWPPVRMYDTTLSAPIFLVPNSAPASWVNILGAAV